MKRLALVLLVACGDADPCEGLAGTCVAVRVTSDVVDGVDQLELDLLYGDAHATLATQPDSGGVATLPLATAIELDTATALRLGIVAAGKLGGNVLGTGAATVEVVPGERADVAIVLAEVIPCTPGGFYCGGDKLAGDAQTLYECNGGGVPLARGVCTAGCLIQPADDDACRAVGGPCIDGGFYCGGDKLDGDPRSLYRCAGGVGVDRQECASRCVIAPAGSDDFCE